MQFSSIRFVCLFSLLFFRFLQIAIIVAIHVNVSECKVTRHSHATKKAIGQQKAKKGQKSIVDAFKGLPVEDIEFLKQLDKQFKQFGDNVQIKVQRDNRTTSKNTKRTIDGSLG